jgi:hypothetical protein
VTRGGRGRERGGEGSPAGTMVKGCPPEELEPPLTWAGKGDRSADRGRSGGDDAWGPPVRMREGGEMRAPVQGNGPNGLSFFISFLLFLFLFF